MVPIDQLEQQLGPMKDKCHGTDESVIGVMQLTWGRKERDLRAERKGLGGGGAERKRLRRQ